MACDSLEAQLVAHVDSPLVHQRLANGSTAGVVLKRGLVISVNGESSKCTLVC